MDQCLHFLDLANLDDTEARTLSDLLHPSNNSSAIEFPWINKVEDTWIIQKGSTPTLNVHAPAFESCIPSYNNHVHEISNLQDLSVIPYSNGSSIPETPQLVNDINYFAASEVQQRTLQHLPESYPNGQPGVCAGYDPCVPYAPPSDSLYDGDFYTQTTTTEIITPVISSFKLNPRVSSFVPQNIESYFPQPIPPTLQQQQVNGDQPQTDNIAASHCSDNSGESHDEQEQSTLVPDANESVVQNGVTTFSEPEKVVSTDDEVKPNATIVDTNVTKNIEEPSKPSRRSWADVVSCGQKPIAKASSSKVPLTQEKDNRTLKLGQASEGLSLEEDKMALALGKHLHDSKLNFKHILLQPRGLINRRNWCYINASLQALFSCPAFYTMLRDLPLGPGVHRGKSSTPVLDSMVKITYEFSQYDNPQEELQPGTPFQPDVIYDMLRDLKSDCLKGQQEDAEEFLSFILNGMHEEMVKVIKHYEKKINLNPTEEIKENGDVSDGEEEWQVIGSKHKGMVTRKVAEHKTPISELLGGQIKSFLTTSGSKTSASIQPFFTLQLDIQSDNVTSVSEALKEMTMKEPIQGYTCAKTKQEVEAFGHIALQKLPPTLILHLKRFVYNINGGCKKVMKKTDYPLTLEIGRELFSADVKKSQRLRHYKLFAVMYHDGEEAIKGHYISDVYSHGSNTWIRCDDRTVSTVTEDQVLSHSPPRVPYLLFYQES